jgi:gliding motility-associated-like protein
MRKMAVIAGLLFCAAGFAQPQSKNGMAPKANNYTRFEAPAARQVTAEMDMRTPEAFKKNPDYGVLPYNSQCADCYELIAERTAYTRLFVKNNTRGSVIYSQAGAHPINFQDAEGNWRAIDPRLSPSGTPNVFIAANQPSPTRIDLGSREVSIANGSTMLSYNRNLKLWHESRGEVKLVAEADWSKATAGSDGARVTDLFPGIDLVVYAVQGGLKSSFVVNGKLSYNGGYLLLEDDMNLPAGASFSTERAVSTPQGYEGMITVREKSTDALLYEIGAAVGYDNSNNRAASDKKFAYRINGNKLAIAVPLDWMNDPSMQYPVTIDPLVTSSGTLLQGNIAGSGGNNSGNFVPASACPYNLSVPVPANCTVTDIRFAFDYIAQNGAWRSEGATDFLYGTCRSPSNSSFYWFCNVNSGGACTTGVAGLSVYSDFQSCIPAPQCASYNMNFTMRFYDRWGTTCSNTWIAANSNWVMMIEGYTVQFTNTSSPISVSASTICANQSITASTAIQYGVPPYNVNWSFNSSGTPSVGTGTSTSISFPGPGTYTLYGIVTDACAQTSSASTVITVNPLPTPTITPAANPLCAGQTTTLTASGATTYTWSANAGGGNGSTASVTPPVGTTVYTVTGASSGCSGTATASVTVNPLPTVGATANPTTICAGQSSTLTASGASTYTWSPNAGSSTSNPTSVTTSATDTYTVTATDNNGCVNSAQVTVTVTPSPTLNVSASPATICAGQTATLSVSGATSYTWSTGSNASTETVSPVGTTTYSVIGDNGGICTATETVVVNVTPLPTLTVSAAPASICTGDSSLLSVSGAATYTWSANAGSATTSTVTVFPSGNTTYTVSGTQSGCSHSQTVTVNVGAVPVVTVSASDTTICSGQATTLSAAGASNYTWLPSGSGSTTNVNPTSSTTYTLIGDNGGCSDTTTFAVTVNPTPTVTAVSSPATICAGASDTLTASGAATYTWSNNAGSATTATVAVTPNSTDTYTVISTDLNGCGDTATVTVNVNALPAVTVNSSTICAGQQTATLTAGGATTYTWSTAQNGGTITVTPSTTTGYTVAGTDNNGCMNSAVSTVVVNQPPTVSVTPAAVTICNTSSTTLTASGALIYTWTPAGSLVPPIGGTVTATPGSTTAYTVTGVDINGCFGSAVTSVSVNPLPVITATTSAASLCAGGTATLSASGGATYTWSANAGSTVNDSASVNPSSSDTYTVTGTDANGCNNSATVNVTVSPLPTLGAVSSQTVCGGANTGSVIFGNSGGSTVNWTNTNPSIGVAASGTGNINGYQAPSVTSTQTGVITATPVDNTSGCVGSSQTFTIVINPQPAISGGAVDSALCGAATGGVSGITVSGGTAPYAYQWYSGGSPVSGATSGTLTSQPIGTYSLVVTDANSCSAASPAFIVPGTPSVTASFVATPTTGIAPLNVSFTNGSVGASSYSWNFGNGTGSSAQNPSATYATGGTYVITLTASNGSCASTYTMTLFVDQAISLTVPNVFTPNGDNINDEFGFVASGITELSCDIYNRWGQKVKTLTSATDKWDGKLDNGNAAADGTYYYMVIAKSFDGKPHNSEGYLTIMR